MALCFDVIPSSCCTTLKISDSSVFTTEVVTDRTLTILVPGYEDPVIITGLSADFIVNLNSVDLGVTETEPGDLPDGLYTITLSALVDAVEVTFEKLHLRNCALLTCYYEELCKIKYECSTCNSSQKTKDLFYIKMYIDAAVAKVEYCSAADEGLAMVSYAKKLLTKYQTGSCITC